MEWAVSCFQVPRCCKHPKSAACRPGHSLDQAVSEENVSRSTRRRGACAARGALQSVRCSESAPRREHASHRTHHLLPAWSQAGCSWVGLLFALCCLCLPCGTTTVCMNDCSAHGSCLNGMCICGLNWGGEDCSSLAYHTNQGSTCASPSLKITALLLQKKGPESIFFEVNVSTGRVTGLRMTLKLHEQAFSGIVVDPVRQRVHLLTSVPSVVHTLELKDQAVSYMSNFSIFEEIQSEAVLHERRLLSAGDDTCSTANGSAANGTCFENGTSGGSLPAQPVAAIQTTRRGCRNLWNLAMWEGQGMLVAVTPRDSGFNTSVLLVNPLSGRATEVQVGHGSPVRGIYTFDRRREEYYFLTTTRGRRNLAVYYAPDGTLSEMLLSFDQDELIGLHYDEGKCRLLAVGLRSPGVLSIQSLEFNESSTIATEVVSLTEAASSNAKAFELVGMTSLLAGQDGTYILCRDPHSSRINVYNLDTDQWYAMDIASEGIVALQAGIRLNPKVSSILPLEVGMMGSSSVTVLGSDFGRADMSPAAYVGFTTSQQVVWTSDSTILVRAPPSPLKSAEFPLKLAISGRGFPTGMKLNYVSSWNSFEPSEGSVEGGQMVTLFGGRFGAGPFMCRFDNISTEGTGFGFNKVVCPVPAWPRPAAMVQLDLISNDVMVKRDTKDKFSFVAGNPVQITVLQSPGSAFGGFPFLFQVALQDIAGNTVLPYSGAFRLHISEWSGSGWTELPIFGNSIQGVDGHYVQPAVHGDATFNISIARHGLYWLNASTEACYCGDLGCTQDDDYEWDGGYGGCDTYAVGQPNEGIFCILDHACEPCACRCSGPCGINSSGPELTAYGICTIGPPELNNMSYSRQMRVVASPCLTVSTQMLIAIGQMARLNVTAPESALASHLLLPQPRVEILDSGGNLASVQVNVSVSIVGVVNPIMLSASVANSIAGIAVFTDVKISEVGSFSLVFSIEDGPSMIHNIVVFHSSPTYLFNAGQYPSRSYVSMQSMQPAPAIRILDQGGNRIENEYWIQDSYGIIASRPLNISIKASLSSVFRNVSSGIMSNPFGALTKTFSLPAEVTEPIGHLYGSTTIILLGDLTYSPLVCPANCSGHGQCQLDLCICADEWRGVGCELPDETITCGEDCPYSGLGYWEDRKCKCLPESAVGLTIEQVGTEASFSELFVDSEGKGFILTFVADGLTPVQSFAFAVEHGIARHLFVVVHPQNGTGGEGLFNAPVVEIRDAGKNLVESDTQGGKQNVTVQLLGNSNSTLIGPKVRLAIGGRAVFGGLKVDLISGVVPYSLRFTAEGLLEAFSQTFHIIPGSPYSLDVVHQPHDARGGLPLAMQPQVQLLDPGGNRVPNTASGWSVTAFRNNGTTYGNLSIPFVAGLARFTDLRIDVLGQTYLTFDSGRNIQPLDSEPFNVTAGPPAIVVILVQPGNGVGGLLATQPRIEVLDGGGNRVEESANASVSARGTLGDYPVGVYQSSAESNIIHFTDLEVLAPAPSTYQLVFSVKAGHEYFSNFFNISVGVPHSLVMSIHPNISSSAGMVLRPQPVVHVVDRAGNLVIQDNILVNVSLNTSSLSRYENPFVSDLFINASCNMSEPAHQVWGTVTVATQGGVAEFTDLDVGMAGMGSRLIFVSKMLQSVHSNAFEVRLGLTPTSLRVLCEPVLEIAGLKFQRQPILQILDLGGNRMHGQVFEATASLLLQTTPGFLSGRLTSILRGDLMTFTDLALDTATDEFRIKFEAPGLQTAITSPITINAGDAAALNIDVLTAVRAFETFNVTVSVRDQGGNLAPPSQQVNINAQLYTVETRSFALECRGLHTCDTDLNLTLPPGSELVSASISLNLSCTDFDSANERIREVTLGAYELEADVEYDSGPWQGCFRNCRDSRPVIVNYDAVREHCWDSRGIACRRVLYQSAWNGIEPRWEFLSRILGQQSSVLPLHIAVPETVNFHPCDGNFVNAIINFNLEYLVPDSTGLLSGQNQSQISNPARSVVFHDFALQVLQQKFVLGFTAQGLMPTFSDVFTLAAGQVKSFRILQQPGNGTGDTILDPQPIIELLDLGGNRVVHASGLAYIVVSSVMAPCPIAMPVGAGVQGNSSIHPSNGIAVFTDLLVGKEHASYVMVFRLMVDDSALVNLGDSNAPADGFFVGNFRDVVCFDCYCEPALRPCVSCAGPVEPAVTVASDLFFVIRGSPFMTAVHVQPGNSSGGEALLPQPVVNVVDMSGNFNAEFNGTMIFADIGFNGAVDGNILGNLSAPVIAGQAVFTDLAIDKVGDSYSLAFSSLILAGVTSNSFNVLAGDAYQLSMIREPSDSLRDRLLSTQPAVAVQDRGGNKINMWQGNVSLALTGGKPFHPLLSNVATPNLLGTLVPIMYRGAAYWYNLRIDKAAMDYVLHFTASGLQGCTSVPFLVSGQGVSQFVFLTYPSIARSFSPLPDIVVAALDSKNDVDAYFSTQELSLTAFAGPESSVNMPPVFPDRWINGLCYFTNIVAEIDKDEVIKLFLTFRFDRIESGDVIFIGPFTGWWNLTYADSNMQLSLKGQYLTGLVSGEWTDSLSGSRFLMISDDVPVKEPKENEYCLLLIATVSKINPGRSAGEPEGSMYMKHCSASAIRGYISTRTSHFNAPETSWARDIQYFQIEEHYPQHETSYYVVVANGYNSTSSSYTANSALYKWNGGQLHLHQEFTNTKSAYSVRYFQMGGAHYLIIANHFDDEGTGYGVPSVLYRYTWVTDKYRFVPVQSISTEGAVAWEYFESDGEAYMAVANFFNGTHYAISSTVYVVARNNPDTPVPAMKQLQAIRTNGARDVAHLNLGITRYLAFANWQGETVDVYQSNTSVPHFVRIQTLQTGPATGVKWFSKNGATYLAVTISDQDTIRVLSNAAQIYRLNLKRARFEPFQNLNLKGLQGLRYFSDGSDVLLSLIEVNEGDNVDARTQIYRWNGTLFEAYLSLPTKNTSSVVIMDVPCDLSGGSSTPGACSEKNEQRLIMAARGNGQGSEIFSLISFEAKSLVTHARFLNFSAYDSDDPSRRPFLNQTLFPTPPFSSPPQVDLYHYQERVSLAWDLPIEVGLQVWSQDIPNAASYEMKAPASGVTSAFTDAQGAAYFSSVRTTYAGVMSLHAFNKYLSDVSSSYSDRITIETGAAYKLKLSGVPEQVISGGVFAPFVSVHDVFGNFKKNAGNYSVNATLVTTSTSILVYNTKAQTQDAIARSAVQFFGNDKDLKVEFTAAGLVGVLSPSFDVIGKAYITDLGPLSIQHGASVTKYQDGGVFFFGGLSAIGTPSNALMKIDTRLPFQIDNVVATGQVPAARFHHAALVLYVEDESMIVLGGEDGHGLIYNDVYSLDINSRVWTHFSAVSFPARAQHSAVNAVLDIPDPYDPSTKQELSLILVFGGRGASGEPLDDLFILQVMPAIIENTLHRPIISGDKPSARYGAFMAWNSDVGYLIGGQNISDDAVYAFNITSHNQFLYVNWKVLNVPAGVASPHPLVVAPLNFVDRLHVVSTTNAANGKAQIFVLDTNGNQEAVWLPTVLAPNGIPAECYALAEISEGRAIVFSSDPSSFSTHAYLISMVTSVALEILDPPPLQISAGMPVFPPPSLKIVDANGTTVKDFGRNPFVHVYAYDSNMNQIPMSGDTSVQAGDGVVVFDFVMVMGGRGSTGIHFVFESDSIRSVSSTTFDVVQGPLAALSFVQNPGGPFRGADFVKQPSVQLEDSAGNRVADNSHSRVTVFLDYKAVESDPWVDQTAWLTGVKTKTPVQGFLEFTDLGISVEAQFGYYRLVARIPGMSAGYAAFTMFPETGNETARGPGTTAYLSIEPVACSNYTVGLSAQCSLYLNYARSLNALIAGVPLYFQPSGIVKLLDPPGLFITGPGIFFDIELAPAVNGVSDLNGTKSVELSQGILNFTDISVNPVGSGYRLVFSSGIFPSAETVEFSVVSGTPSSMTIPRAVNGAFGGLAFQQQPIISVLDISGNFIAISVPITATLSHPTATAVLKGNPVATTVFGTGTASFTDLTVDPVGTGYSLNFALYDTCCGASLGIESPTFTVTYSGQASLLEVSSPGGALAGKPFVSQPSVAIKDFGGNLLSVNGTLVTASIERDATTRMLPPKLILASSKTVSRVLYFKVNATEYLLVANLFDGTTYYLNSTLYTWDAAAAEMKAVQNIETQGAQHLCHFVQDRIHYVVVANSFEVVTIDSGQIEGTYNTLSKVYRLDESSGKLVYVTSIPTHGVKAIEPMQIGGTTMLLVANNYNDNSTQVNSVVYRFNPKGNSSHPHIVEMQQLPTTAASFFHYFRGSEGEDLAIAAQYFDENVGSYISNSIVYRLREGKLQMDDTIPSSGLVSIKSFYVGSRRYVVFGNGFGLNHTSDPGVVVVYEHLHGKLIVRQQLDGFVGLSDIEYFHSNGAEWLVVTTDPVLAGSNLTGGNSIFTWDTSNCTTSAVLCAEEVKFLFYSRLDCTRCGTTSHFMSAWDNHYILYASLSELNVLSFYSDAALLGNTIQASTNGIVQFTDLYINIYLAGISLSYRSGDLRTAYGGLFSVDYGPISTIRVDTFPVSGVSAVAFALQPIVVLRDLGGNLMPFQHDGKYVTVSIAVSGGQPTYLTGSSSAMIQNGRATFTNLGVSLASWHVLNFTYAQPLNADLFDSINMTIAVGKPHHMAFKSSSDVLYGGMVFGKQPSFALYDAGNNFVADGSTRIGVAKTSLNGFEMLPFTDNADFEGLLCAGVEFFAYRDLGYVVAFGWDVLSGTPVMKLYKWGCNSLIPVQTWSTSVVQVSFWMQENTTWMATVGTNSACVMYSFNASQELFVRRGYFMMPGLYRVLPILLGGDELHFAAAVDSSYEKGAAGVVLLRASEFPSAGNWSMNNVQNWTVQVKVVQNITSAQAVAAFKGFDYVYKEWLVVLADSKISLYRWGEYLTQYFHLHDSLSIGTLAFDLSMLFRDPVQPPAIAVACSQQVLVVDLKHTSFSLGISLQSTPTTYLLEAKRVRFTRKGDEYLLAVASSSKVFVMVGTDVSGLELTWQSTDKPNANYTAVAWGWYRGNLHLVYDPISGDSGAVQKVHDRGYLSGTTVVTAANGYAYFTDLQLDLIGNYTLTFTAVGLQNDFSSSEVFDAYKLQSERLEVKVGNPAAVVLTSDVQYGNTATVKLVDGGGNDVAVGSTKTKITGSTVVYSEYFNISGNIAFDMSTTMHQSCMLACSALFPETPEDGMLWHFGGGAGSRMAWLGIRDSAISPILRVRVGRGDNIVVGQSLPNISYVDVKDFPKDGRLHEVVVEIALDYKATAADSRLWLKLYIDGELKGSAFMNSHAWVGSSGSHSYGLRAYDGDIPVGEPNLDWPGSVSKKLRVYAGTNWDPYCVESLLRGDWVTGTVNSLQYICCDDYYGCPKVSAVLDNPAQMHDTVDLQQIFSTNVRDVEHFVIGTQHFVVVANNFDGIRYRIDSTVFVWKDEENRLEAFQGLTTKGAYDFEFFTMHLTNVSAAGPGRTIVEEYLVVANHFDDVEGYLTQSTIYKWNASISKFQSFQNVVTEGATKWDAFEVEGVQHLVVSNFFDGTFHAVNSVVYKWTDSSQKFTVSQYIPTMGAHSVRHIQHAGEHFLFFAQYRMADEVSLSPESVIYKWDSRSASFQLLTMFESSAAMHIEPFEISGILHFAVANYANSTTGNLITNSTIYNLSCSQGVYQTSMIQSIPTYGGVFAKHFTRGGIHYLAVSNWRLGTEGSSTSPGRCDGMTPSLTGIMCTSSIDIYLWNGASFELYSQTTGPGTGTGAFSFDVMLIDEFYYLLSAMVEERSSGLARYGANLNAGQVANYTSFGFLWDGPISFPEFDEYLTPYSQAPTKAQKHWGIEFVSLPLVGTATGAYYNASSA